MRGERVPAVWFGFEPVTPKRDICERVVNRSRRPLSFMFRERSLVRWSEVDDAVRHATIVLTTTNKELLRIVSVSCVRDHTIQIQITGTARDTFDALKADGLEDQGRSKPLGIGFCNTPDFPE